MTVGTRIDSTIGVNTTNNGLGASIERSTSNYGFMPYRVDATRAMTATATLLAGDAGVLTLSGATAALTGTLPTAASCAGALFIFRNLNLAAHGHRITSSQETAGDTVITDGTTKGAALVMSGAIGVSVALLSDGVSFLVMAHSSGAAGASYTIS